MKDSQMTCTLASWNTSGLFTMYRTIIGTAVNKCNTKNSDSPTCGKPILVLVPIF